MAFYSRKVELAKSREGRQQSVMVGLHRNVAVTLNFREILEIFKNLSI